MVSTRHTQSLTDFRQKASETLERINRTGEAEILTVNGEAKAVLLSPVIYDELAREAQLSRDVAAMRRSREQIDQGKSRDVDAIFDDIRSRLLEMKKKRPSNSGK
ncbi:MAG: type II toxin-antitoxin system Phd/YefM family antitoxin [Phycisphaerales bacterium]|nr:type II toxin-antitoxin system Phd/YefM family antitoxin [Phycisphaerales bacterium]